MARPTDYGPQIVEQAEAYLYQFRDDTFDKEAVQTIEGLALHLGTHKDTVYAWEKEHAEFSDVTKRVRTTKSFSLQNGSLKGKLNPQISKLLLGHEGYRETQDITSDGKALPQPILNAVKDDENS